MYKLALTAFAAAGMLVSLSVSESHAQVRTWVSATGDDANPCSLFAPCKTLAAAYGKTQAGGEISVLNSNSIGSLTISKSISIVAEGSEGSITSQAANAIVINSPTAVVNIRGLMIEGGGTGFSGIRILQAASVHIEKVMIRNYMSNISTTNGGIEILPGSGTPKVKVVDSTIADSTRGIVVQTSGAMGAHVTLSNVRLTGHSGAALRATGGSAVVWLDKSLISGNATGLTTGSGGTIHSMGNNTVVNNTTNGAPTDTVPQM